MDQRIVDAAAIEAEVNQIRSLGIDALRQRWRATFGAVPPKGLTKDILGRMIAYRIQEDVFGGLDRDLVKLLDRLARGEKPNEINRRLKPGTVLIREYQGGRHTVTIVPDGFLWGDKTYSSLSVIAQAITGTKWNGPRFFGLRMSRKSEVQESSRKTFESKSASRASQGRSSIRPYVDTCTSRRAIYPGHCLLGRGRSKTSQLYCVVLRAQRRARTTSSTRPRRYTGLGQLPGRSAFKTTQGRYRESIRGRGPGHEE